MNILFLRKSSEGFCVICVIQFRQSIKDIWNHCNKHNTLISANTIICETQAYQMQFCPQIFSKNNFLVLKLSEINYNILRGRYVEYTSMVSKIRLMWAELSTSLFPKKMKIIYFFKSTYVSFPLWEKSVLLNKKAHRSTFIVHLIFCCKMISMNWKNSRFIHPQVFILITSEKSEWKWRYSIILVHI